MALSIYTGNPGAGKTYEVVCYVILKALSERRRVVTNISGLKVDAIRKYLIEKRSVDPDDLGELVSFRSEAVLKPNFFPDGEGAESFVKNGDLVVVDEVWSFWGRGKNIPEEHVAFFREHRHFTHAETGRSCDIVLITQVINDVKPVLRDIAQFSFRAKKLDVLGRAKSYSVQMWSGYNQREKPASVTVRNYDKAIFGLYQSYSKGKAAGFEGAVDSRQNILNSWTFKFGVPAFLVVCVLGLYAISDFFTGGFAGGGDQPEPVAKVVQVDAQPVRPVGSVAVRAGRSTVPEKGVVSDVWRLAGFVASGDRRMVLLVNSSGRIRFEGTAKFRFVGGLPVDGEIDGKVVNSWSGAGPAAENTADVSPVTRLRQGSPFHE